MEQNCTAIVVAAGRGTRMQSEVPKIFMELGGYPVLFYSLRCLEESSFVKTVVLVVSREMLSYTSENIIKKYGFQKIQALVAGGQERYDSVYAGLCACPDSEYVMIHDGARPLLTEEMIINGLESVRETGAAVTAVPVKDTIKLQDEEGFVESTPDRNRLMLVQTPQIFRYELIRQAYESLLRKNQTSVTDDAMVVEQETGVKVKFSRGSYENIKITTPEDLDVAAVFLKRKG